MSATKGLEVPGEGMAETTDSPDHRRHSKYFVSKELLYRILSSYIT